MAGKLTRGAWIPVGAALLVVIAAAGGEASASNMAFKLNKQVCVLGNAPVGQNLVALPHNHPYEGAGGLERLCTALGLGTTAQLTQWDGTGNVFVHNCGQVQQFDFLKGKGVMITEPAGTKTGILVGSDSPGKSLTMFDLAQEPIGINIYPVDYHTTAVTPEDLCVDCGLSSTAQLSRFDACSGQIFTHRCGQTPQWNLVMGEALLILEDNGPKTCVPSHF